MPVRHLTGLFTLRRLRLLGLEKPQLGCPPFVRFSLRHILVACKRKSGVGMDLSLLRLPIRQPKRRKQPERYVQCVITLSELSKPYFL